MALAKAPGEARDAGRRGHAAKGRPRGSKADTQERILEAATELFAARGYERASISAMAERAKVSRAAIFWHFGDKETLFRESFRRMLEPFVEELGKPDPAPETRVLHLLEVYEHFVGDHQATIEAIVRWVLESPGLRRSLREPLLALHEHYVRDVARALAESTPDAETARALGAAVVSLLDGNLLLALLDRDPERRRLRQAGLRLLLERVLPASGVR